MTSQWGERGGHLPLTPSPKWLLCSSRLPHAYSHQGTGPRCRLRPFINPDHIMAGPGSFTCRSASIVYAIACLGCPSALCAGQTGLPLRVSTSGHQPAIDTGQTQRSAADPRASPDAPLLTSERPFLCNKTLKNKFEQDIAEQNVICSLGSVKSGLSRDDGSLSHYLDEL